MRGQRIGIRLKDLDSEEAKNYRGPVFFPLDLSYRVTATWVPSDGKKTVDVPNVLGDTTPTPVAGTVVFKINGQEVRLTDLGGDPAERPVFRFQRSDQQDRHLPRRPLPGNRSGGQRDRGDRL